MRVAHKFMYDSVIRNMMTNASLLARATERAASGKLIAEASEDPPKASVMLAMRSRISELNQYEQNLNEAVAWLDETSSSIVNLREILQRAKGLTLQGLNDTQSASSRAAIADEIEEMVEAMGSIANHQLAGKYIFAGQKYLNPAFTGIPIPAYQGDSGAINREIAPGIKINIAKSGDKVFNVGGATVATDPDMFTAFQELATALRSENRTDMDTGLARVERALDYTLSFQTELGAQSNLVETARTDIQTTKMHLVTLLSETTDADLAEAITNANIRQTMYQASLGVAARMIQPSLLDFLR